MWRDGLNWGELVGIGLRRLFSLMGLGVGEVRVESIHREEKKCS